MSIENKKIESGDPKVTEKDANQENDTVKRELQKKAEWLGKSIDDAIKHTQRNKRKNRNRASIIKVSTISFSGLATILLGLKIVGYEVYFKEIAFVLGAIVTLLNALEPFFNFRALWVEHEAAQANFHRLKGRLDFLMAGLEQQSISKEKLFDINQEYEEIWTTLSDTWIRYRREGQQANL